MSSVPTTDSTPHQPSYLAAFLSYLIPGLGQIMQGRYGKGLLFMVSLLGMFHLGEAMGNWQNVYVPRGDDGPQGRGRGGFIAGLFTRWHYAGQFWIGTAAWPALWQHFELPLPKQAGGYLGASAATENQTLKILSIAANSPAERARLQTGDTILKIDDAPLASMDAFNGLLRTKLPGTEITIHLQRGKQTLAIPVVLGEHQPGFWRNYQKMPEEGTIQQPGTVNHFLVNAGKSPDLGWVYTVIAGMLNILVIYDAYAGAAVLGHRPTTKPQPAVPATTGGAA